CNRPWGFSKAVLILATQRDRFTVVLAEAVEQEIRRALARMQVAEPADAHALRESIEGWFRRVRLERHPLPSLEELEQYALTLLPRLRHRNDLLAVITAIKAQPDWIVSANRTHWNDPLAALTGLRIVSPHEFLRHLTLPPRT